MNNQLCKEANRAYREGRFRDALVLYKEASNALGINLNANIVLCEKNIKKQNKEEATCNKQNKKFSVLTLLDPISELCWKNQFHGYPLSISSFEEQIAISKADFAFFESAWRANKGTWEYAFTSPGLKHKNALALLSAIDLLKKKKIPILFWNKEDPMHFDTFLPITKKFDFIFTTDELSVKNYQKALGHKNIKVIPFAAPIEITNPEDRFKTQQESICFAGTYYAKNHEDRKKQMDAILPSIIEFNGVIYDRASSIGGERYSYPDIYHKFIRPAVEFDEIISIYKKFKVFLNVNTIRNSPTMMSRRVYELLASGTPVISTPCRAITEQFPGIVLTANNANEASIAADKLLSDNMFWCKQSQLGIREVLNKHTYTHRWANITEFVLNNSDSTLVTAIPKVSLVIEIKHLEITLEQIKKVFMGTLRPSQIIFYSKEIAFNKIKNSEIFTYLTKFLSQEDIEFIEFIPKKPGILPLKKDIDYIIFFSNNFMYSSNYIADLLLPFKYSKAKATTKPNPLQPFDLDSRYLNNKIGDIKSLWHSKTTFAVFGTSAIRKENIDEFYYDEDTHRFYSLDSNECIYISDFFNAIDLGSQVEVGNIKEILYKYLPKISL